MHILTLALEKSQPHLKSWSPNGLFRLIGCFIVYMSRDWSYCFRCERLHYFAVLMHAELRCVICTGTTRWSIVFAYSFRFRVYLAALLLAGPLGQHMLLLYKCGVVLDFYVCFTERPSDTGWTPVWMHRKKWVVHALSSHAILRHAIYVKPTGCNTTMLWNCNLR